MEAMQLQPVKANMTYPSRISRVLDLPNKQDIIEVEPVLSRREVKDFLSLKPTQKRFLWNI